MLLGVSGLVPFDAEANWFVYEKNANLVSTHVCC